MSGSELVTLLQLIKIIEHLLKKKADIRFLTDKTAANGEVCSLRDFDYVVDLRKAQNILNLRQKTTLEEGLRKTFEWWSKN